MTQQSSVIPNIEALLRINGLSVVYERREKTGPDGANVDLKYRVERFDGKDLSGALHVSLSHKPESTDDASLEQLEQRVIAHSGIYRRLPDANVFLKYEFPNPMRFPMELKIRPDGTYEASHAALSSSSRTDYSGGVSLLISLVASSAPTNSKDVTR